MPSGFRRLIKRLLPSPTGHQASVPKPFDPFDPVHDAPRQVNLPDILDQDVMITRLVDSVRNVELLPETCAVRGFDELENTPWTPFFSFCEACKQCILSESPGLIGTLEWFNMARRAQLEQSPDGSPALCYVCWIVLRIRMLSFSWSAGSYSLPLGYTVAANWHPSGMLDSMQIGCVLYFDGKLPFQPRRPPPEALDTRAFVDPHSRLIPTTEPKFDMITSWMHECEKSHGPRCNNPLIHKGMDRNLTLIDVDQRCLVEAPGNSRYVVLSYVWGADQLKNMAYNRALLFQPGGLDNPAIAAQSAAALGRVVTDSMAITARLGERYLWIDALCIRQDGKEDKALEIERMASIYSCAVVTVVPIENTTAHQAIPGMGGVGRGQMSEGIVDGVSVGVREWLLAVIGRSHYNTRGWCYQEAALSRRTLYFSKQQVFFRCQEHVRSEDSVEQWIWDLWTRPHNALTSLGIINDIATWKLHQPCDQESQRRFFEGYDNVVGQYWNRSLTENTDIMDAFSAISAALEVHLDTRISAGLPENIFHHALLWNIRTPRWSDDAWVYPGSSRGAIRSAGGDLIPSWSWMGWRKYCCDNNHGNTKGSPVSMSGGMGFLSLSSGLVPLINDLKIEIRGELRPVEALLAVYEQSDQDTETCPHMHLRPEKSDLEQTCQKAPAIPGHNILRFQASVASLQSLGIRFEHHPYKFGTGNPNLYGVHHILDSQSRRCGRYSGLAVSDVDCGQIDVVVLSCLVWKDTKISVHKMEDGEDRTFDCPPYEIAQWKTLNFIMNYFG
ncbi:hypothetical protein VM1G_04844 [Cytospora mali]|uniref:Heterokaryon incompatibility domain-containing protein n=1 Tax=Cytospora mali TaxID=578113 RepID=A0A194W0X7_CYTMA|nr:hypothetical protein VM1G_04844 [Valsa mali]